MCTRMASHLERGTAFRRATMWTMKQIMEGGDFVAVTGDGVNEAPVLNHVHVAIALGIT